MNNDNNCMYCTQNENLQHLMIEIATLGVSTLYLFKEQSYKGRCVLAYNGHVNQLFELSDENLALFMKDVKKVALAVDKAFSPTKINYGAFSDTLSHLHMHIVPKYEGGYTWGKTFEMNPQKVYFNEDEYKNIISMIKENL